MTEPFPTFIDSTMREDFVSCPRQFYESHICHRKKRDTNVHLHFGTCFARGQETFRRAFWSEKSPLRGNVLECAAKAATAIIAAWGEYDPEIETTKTLDRCIEALQSYIETYPPERDAITPYIVKGEPAVEPTFVIPIPGIIHPTTSEPILYTGRYDMLAQFAGSPGLFIEDDKTTTALGNSWLSNWKLRGQLTGYAWAAREYGLQISGIIVRGVAILKRDITHAQAIEQRPNWLIEKWVTQLQHDVERMIGCWKADYWDYSFGHACTAYGGCAYLDLCSSQNPEIWHKDYVTRLWDPLQKTS